MPDAAAALAPAFVPAAVAVEQRRLLFLHHPASGRRLRLEAPTVFGRSAVLHDYEEESVPRFSAADARRLRRLDWVEIEGDLSVSRTHGVIDPAWPDVRDLNSRNGIEVNGRRVPTTRGRPGPPFPLRQGDLLTVGGIHFVVEADQAGQDSLCRWLALDRQALLAGAEHPEVPVLEAFLRERKGFRTHGACAWSELRGRLGALAAPAQRLPILVVVLAGRPEGDGLWLGSERVTMAEVLAALASVPGSKVLALQADGDPAGCEAAFRDLALHDTLLVTSTVPHHSGLLDPLLDDGPVIPTTLPPGRARAAHHSVLDGLDALIPLDSNVLDLEWIQGYEGALTVIAGLYVTDPGTNMAVSYRSDGSERIVRHRFDARVDVTALPPDPQLSPSWRYDGRS